MFKIPLVKTVDMESRILVSVSLLEQGIGSKYWIPLYNKYKLDIPKKYRINSIPVMNKVLPDILREWRNMILEAEAGIVLTNFGYFFVARSIEKVAARVYNPETEEIDFRYCTGNNMRPSRIMFIPSYKRNLDLYGWSMDSRTTLINTKKIWDNTLRKAVKYKGYPYTFKQMKLI